MRRGRIFGWWRGRRMTGSAPPLVEDTGRCAACDSYRGEVQEGGGGPSVGPLEGSGFMLEVLFGSQGILDASKMPPRCFQEPQDAYKMPPRWRKMPQDASKMPPRPLQDVPRCPQDSPRRPKTPQDTLIFYQHIGKISDSHYLFNAFLVL